jgi:hypothetical protein
MPAADRRGPPRLCLIDDACVTWDNYTSIGGAAHDWVG